MKKRFKLLLFAFAFAVLTVTMSTTAFAAGGDGTGNTLTDLFYTEAFSGSWTVFSKFNWLGMIMQFIISAFCLIGLFLIAYQRLITMLYLAAKNTFDKVDELKSGVGNKRFLGLGGMFKDNFFESKNGIGLDAFVSFLLTLLPNVKAYSDYSPDSHHNYNLNEDDTITTYMLKVAIPTIMLIFFFAIGFNGTLFKAYGNVVDAMATVADDFVTTDLSSTVQKWVNSGTGYQFAYDNGTEYGKFQQELAEDMYAKILRRSTDLTTQNKQAIGSAVKEQVDKITGTNIGGSSNSDFKGNITCTGWGDSVGTLGDDAWKNLIYTITINTTQKFSTDYGWSSGSGMDLSTFKLSNGNNNNKWYVHVIIQKKSNSNETDYFKLKDGSTGASGNKNGGNTNKGN